LAPGTARRPVAEQTTRLDRRELPDRASRCKGIGRISVAAALVAYYRLTRIDASDGVISGSPDREAPAMARRPGAGGLLLRGAAVAASAVRRLVRVALGGAAGLPVCGPPGRAAEVFMIAKTFYCAGSSKSS
jgi:hypothetical protein